jgi:hypothetical protein
MSYKRLRKKTVYSEEIVYLLKKVEIGKFCFQAALELNLEALLILNVDKSLIC